MEVLKNIQIKTEVEITEATLLSVEEAKALPQRLKSYKDYWWLRSPGYLHNLAASVGWDGSVYHGGSLVINGGFYVRPALKLVDPESSGLMVGDRFEFGNAKFEVVSDSLAFCTGNIGRRAFRKNWKAGRANVYEASDIKKFVDEWFNNALKECDADSSADREIYEKYKNACLKEDFESWLHENPDIEFSETQIKDLINSNFCERFEKALGRNDAYWDAYWATVESVALEIIKEIKEGK